MLTVKSMPSIHKDLTPLQRMKKLDLQGGAILIGGVVCLLLALQWGGTRYPWSNSKVWGCLLGFSLFLVGFVALQIHKKDR